MFLVLQVGLWNYSCTKNTKKGTKWVNSILLLEYIKISLKTPWRTKTATLPMWAALGKRFEQGLENRDKCFVNHFWSIRVFLQCPHPVFVCNQIQWKNHQGFCHPNIVYNIQGSRYTAHHAVKLPHNHTVYGQTNKQKFLCLVFDIPVCYCNHRKSDGISFTFITIT